MSKELEILKKIKVALGIEKEVEQTEVELAEDNKEVKKENTPDMPTVDYATRQELSDVRNEVLSMLKALIEENKKSVKEVPQELSKQDVNEIELSAVEEIVHTPDVEVKSEPVSLSKPIGAMTIQERIREKLSNL